MKQATTDVAKRTSARWIIAALLLALGTALAAYPTSPALAQEEAAQEEAAQPSPSDEATLSFELTVRNGLPEGTSVFGFIPAEGGITVPLADSDGDGVFTGSTTLDRFGPGPRPVPPGTEPVSLPVQIAARENGGPIEVIRDFGVVPLEGDRTFSARVNFKRDRGDDTETPEGTTPATPDPGSGGSGDSDDSGSNDGDSGGAPDPTAPENGVDLNEDGSTDGADGEVAASTSDAAMEAHRSSGGRTLPATGGAATLPIAGTAGTLLVVVASWFAGSGGRGGKKRQG